jgi:hypothetical protein
MRSCPPLLLSLALAAPAVARGSVDTRGAVLQALLLANALEEPLLVGIRGGDRAELWERLSRLEGGERALLVELSDGPLDLELALVMGREGARCALSMESLGDERWELSLWGSCADPPGILAGGEASTGTRVARSLGEGDPWEAAERSSLRLVPGAAGAFAVEDGSGFPYDTMRFALQVGDLATVEQLERERRSGSSVTVGLAVVGGGAVLTGLGLMFAGFGDAAGALDYEAMALSNQVGWTGVVVAGGGGMVLSGIPRLRRSLVQRRERPDRFYDRERAQELVDRYDHALEEELGVEPARREEAP